MVNDQRRLDLSSKLLEMGKSLIEEGTNRQDYTITQSGNIMIIISAAILTDEHMFLFSEVCSMFTAKQVLDEIKNIDEFEALKKYMEINGIIKKNFKKESKKRKPRNPPSEQDDNLDF